MASEAVLYVEIVPTTKGIKGKVEREFNQGFGGVEQRGATLWSRIGDGVKGLAGTVTGVLGAAFAKAIGGGLSRLLNIEDAQAKLKGLGNDAATVTAIMNDALAAVRGTAFGMDAAATTAASAVAAGIKPGQELEKYLRLTADAATIAGTSMSEMGGIINKVTANGKAMTENLYQLQDRGIPIMQWLAKEYGVSADALQKMVSKGKVDAATFRRVIEENIGGAALASGDTTRGAFANMNAALNRVGANLLGSVFPLFRETFVGIIDLLAPVEERAKAVGDAIGRYVVPLFESLAGSGDQVSAALSGLAPVLGPLVGMFLTLGAGALPGLLAGLPVIGPMLSGLLGPLRMLAGTIGLLAGAFAGLLAVSPGLRREFGDGLSTIFTALSSVVDKLRPTLDLLLSIVGNLATQLGGALALAIASVAPLLADFVGIVGNLLVQILPLLIPVVMELANVFMEVVWALVPLLPQLIGALLPIFEALVPIVRNLLWALLPIIPAVLTGLLPVVQALIPVLMDVAEKILPVGMALMDALLPAVLQLVDALLPLVGPILELLVLLLGAILPVAIEFVSGYFLGLLSAITPIVDALATALIPIIEGLVQVLGGVIDFLLGVFTGDWGRAWGGILDIFAGIWNSIVSIVEGVVNVIIGIINGLIMGVNAITGTIGIPAIGLIGYVNWSGAKLEDGGLIKASRGGTQVTVGEGRYDETVMPLGGPQLDRVREALSGTSDGVTHITVQALPGMTPEEQARLVARSLRWGAA